LKKNPINIEQIEQQFREVLKDSAMNPPPGIWEGVSSGLSVGVQSASILSNFIVVGKIIAGAAILGGAAYGIITLTSNEANNLPVSVSQLSDSTKTKYQENISDNKVDLSEDKTNLDVEYLKQPSEKAIDLGLNHTTNNASTIQQYNTNNILNPTKNTDNPTSVQEKLTIDIISGKVNVISNPTCVGEMLEATASASSTMWYLNGIHIGTGEKISYIVTQNGTLLLEAKLNESSIFSQKLKVFSKQNHKIIIQSIDKISHFVEISPKPNGFVTWEINGQKYPQSELVLNLDPNVPHIIKSVISDVNCGEIVKTEKYLWKNQAVIKKERQKEIFIPNIFTPNNDGVNDSYHIDIPQTTTFSLLIFDKEGEDLVFSTNNQNDSWDGIHYKNNVNCEDGSYLVKLIYQLETDVMPTTKNYYITLKRN
jgi:gliding motility-associated-like protein